MVLTPILVEQGVREEELVLLLSLSLCHSETLSLPPTHVVHNMSVSVTPRTFFLFFFFLATPLSPQRPPHH